MIPNIQFGVMAWAKPTEVYCVGKRQQDFKVIESMSMQTVKLMRQPKLQPLEMKSEGQRRWIDETVYAEPQLNLKVDDIILFGCPTGKRYRVMDKVDWSQYGYIEYSIKSDYQ